MRLPTHTTLYLPAPSHRSLYSKASVNQPLFSENILNMTIYGMTTQCQFGHLVIYLGKWQTLLIFLLYS